MFPQKVGGVADLRADAAGHNVLDAANFVKEMPRRPLLEQNACMRSQCVVDAQGQLSMPRMAFGHSLEGKCGFTAPDAFNARRACMRGELSRIRVTMMRD